MRDNPNNRHGQEPWYQLTGWILFIICAIFYIVASVKNHDILIFIGSVIFLIACMVFLIPLLRSYKNAKSDSAMPGQENSSDKTKSAETKKPHR